MAYDSQDYDDADSKYFETQEDPVPILRLRIAELEEENDRLEAQAKDYLNQLMSTIAVKDRMMFDLIMAGALTKPKPVTPANPECSESPDSVDSSPSRPE